MGIAKRIAKQNTQIGRHLMPLVYFDHGAIAGSLGGMTFQSVTVEITQRCNLNCVYCYNYWKNPRFSSKDEPHSHNYHKKLLGRILRTVDTEHIVFSGGEPFTLEHLLDLCLFVRMKGKRVSIVSNGTNEDAALYTKLLDLGVRSYMLPLHSGNPAIHDRMTRTPGSWHRSLSSMQTIISLGGRVSAAIVITSLNYAEIGKTIKLLQSIGVRRVMLDRITLAGEALNNPEIIPSKFELTEAFAAADSAANYYKADVRSNICTPACIVDPLHFPNIRFPLCPNAGTVVSPLIDWQGDIRACTVSPTVIGNIFRDEVDSVLNSDYFRKWKEPPALCTRCDRFAECSAGCRAAAEHIGLGPENPDPVIGTMIEGA